MKDWKLTQTKPLFDRIRKHPGVRVSQNPAVILLLFAAALFCSVCAETVLGTVPQTVLMMKKKTPQDDPDIFLILGLMLTFVNILIPAIVCVFAEKRPLRTMGFTRKRCMPDYLTGLLLGFCMMSAVVMAAWKAGAIRLNGGFRQVPVLTAAVTAVGWGIQGLSEEVTFRGYLMMSLGTRTKPWMSVAVSSLLFAFAHAFNDGFSLPAFVNLFLFGVTEALLVLRTDSIWAAAALHSVWNWAQGSFYGLTVSGLMTASSFLVFEQTGSANWIGGKTFGLEAGAGTTAVCLLVSIILLSLIPQRAGSARLLDRKFSGDEVKK
ncbi:MAG: CPBP family intramembrane metalloprotease [Oscillospiraceae bacterium]|nr:CPBP family intramembrane metalloprotease [Oscillospiraceae bacterium]